LAEYIDVEVQKRLSVGGGFPCLEGFSFSGTWCVQRIYVYMAERLSGHIYIYIYIYILLTLLNHLTNPLPRTLSTSSRTPQSTYSTYSTYYIYIYGRMPIRAVRRTVSQVFRCLLWACWLQRSESEATSQRFIIITITVCRPFWVQVAPRIRSSQPVQPVSFSHHVPSPVFACGYHADPTVSL